jgi:hypothetical protein
VKHDEQKQVAGSGAKGDGWQPIETAPKDGTPVLIARVEYTEGKSPEVAEVDVGAYLYDAGMNTPDGYEPAYWYWASDNGSIEEPTHWMPLPPAPQPTNAVERKD